MSETRKIEDMAPDELARACADAMWANDATSKGLGMKIEEVTAGKARLTMTVTENMVNGYDMAHGGMIFTLADSAFAFACNGYNQITVAQHCSITFLAPAFRGDVLSADAREVTRAGRSGIYDITITNQKGERIAEFRGHSRAVKGAPLS